MITEKEITRFSVTVMVSAIVLGLTILVVDAKQTIDNLRQELKASEKRIHILEADLSATMKMVNR